MTRISIVLLVLAVHSFAGVTVNMEQSGSSVTATWSLDATPQALPFTWSGDVADFNTYGFSWDDGTATVAPDLRTWITGATFQDGWVYTFDAWSDGAGDILITLISETAPPGPDLTTNENFFWSGWNLCLTFFGFALVLRAIKGLRGPGSGEI